MTEPRVPPRPRRRSRARTLRWLLALVSAVTLFAVGVAIGESLKDNPQPGLTTTSITTLRP